MGISSDRRRLVRIEETGRREVVDHVVVEAPLTVVVGEEVMATTMRTPGHDLELAAGWLVNEAGVRRSDDITTMAALATRDEDEGIDTVRVRLADGVTPPRARAFITSSSCGVCSSDVLSAAPQPTGPLHTPDWSLDAEAVGGLLAAMREDQRLFERTGGLHAATVVAPDLSVRWTREDVGRHNAVDKAVGAALLADQLPLTDHTLLVSGRVSYEIVTKALTAGVAAIVAVSAPTSLAIDLARQHDLVLIGFARGSHLNVYAGDNRVTSAHSSS
ncbi:MAG: formate dehydrogenase accessory sulfurtransferase FdhD [Actinomycetales bacterium]|nr:formate dehydrogenase accessory sulfurtransferase FdhD [Actinomycetales bacterium]